MDTDFGRARRAMLRQGEGDRVPLFEISIDKSIREAFLGRPIQQVQDDIEFWQAAGYDFIPMRSGVRSIVRGYHPVVKEWLKERRGLDPDVDAGSWVIEGGAIVKDREEFEAFPWPSPEELGGYNDYDVLSTYVDSLTRHLPSHMKVLAQLGYIFMGAWQLLGFENFCVKLVDDPDLIQDVFAKLGESQLAVLKILLSYDCMGTIWLPDDLCYNSGPIASPGTYRKYVYPWYEKIVARCHQADIPVGLHSDGDLGQLLPDLVACGFDCIHPFEPPMNDIVAVKREWGDRIALAGNIDLKMTLCGGTPQDVEEEVKSKIAALAPGGGWLLGSSNSIPDFVPLENYKALLSTGVSFGKYNHS